VLASPDLLSGGHFLNLELRTQSTALRALLGGGIAFMDVTANGAYISLHRFSPFCMTAHLLTQRFYFASNTIKTHNPAQYHHPIIFGGDRPFENSTVFPSQGRLAVKRLLIKFIILSFTPN
jgi:hypothetical protein